MTNRERLLKTNEYDTLLKMQKNLEAYNVSGKYGPCIMDVLGAFNTYDRHMKYNGNCEMCIAEWLGEETTLYGN